MIPNHAPCTEITTKKNPSDLLIFFTHLSCHRSHSLPIYPVWMTDCLSAFEYSEDTVSEQKLPSALTALNTITEERFEITIFMQVHLM